MLKNKLMLLVLVVIVSVITVLSGQLCLAAKHAKALAIKVNTLQANLIDSQTSVIYLTDKIELSESTKEKLLAERKLISEIQIKANQESKRLQNELEVANEKVKQIRVSKNENLKSWANTVMPNDAVSLLKYARATGNHANSDNYQAGIHDATSRHAAILSAPNSF